MDGWMAHVKLDNDTVMLFFTRAKLYVLSRCEPVLTFVKKADYQFYQNLVEVLIPDVLRPIPGTLTQAIRNFAKGLENWLLTAMNGCPEDIIIVKVHIHINCSSLLVNKGREMSSIS